MRRVLGKRTMAVSWRTLLASTAAGLLLVSGAPGQTGPEGTGVGGAAPGAGIFELIVQAADSVRRVSLAEALELAKRRNPTLRQARASLDVAETNRLGSYGSFLPDLSLGYGFSKSSTGRIDDTGRDFTQRSYSARLTGSYDLFSGFRRFNDLAGARKEVAAQEATYEQREYETALNVKTAFYDAVANRELVRVEEDRVARQEDQLDFVRQQVELGRSTRSDLLRSRVDLNDARLALINARNAARNSAYALAEVVGVTDPVVPVEEAALELTPIRRSRDELERILLERAPSVVSARASAAAAEAAVAGAKSAYLPSFRVSGGWDWRTEDFPPGNRSWSLSISGSYPLFNGLQRETSVARAGAQARRAEAQRTAEELAIRTRLDDAWGRIETARAGVDLAEQNVELATEDLRVTRQRYELGVATILDLQSAQITLEQAEVNRIQRYFDYQVGLAQLEALLGMELRGDGDDERGTDASER